jgi:hypothetical protein
MSGMTFVYNLFILEDLFAGQESLNAPHVPFMICVILRIKFHNRFTARISECDNFITSEFFKNFQIAYAFVLLKFHFVFGSKIQTGVHHHRIK